MTSVPVRDMPDGARFPVRVTPRASRSALAGIHGEGSEAALKIALHAPPAEGRANAALIEFLAEWLHVPRSSIEICAGEHGRKKTILVRDRRAAEIATAIESSMAVAHK